MQSFAYHSPTKLHFGVGAVVDHMADELTSSGCKTALVVTGGATGRSTQSSRLLKLRAFAPSRFRASNPIRA